jgi:hypothetical protein
MLGGRWTQATVGNIIKTAAPWFQIVAASSKRWKFARKSAVPMPFDRRWRNDRYAIADNSRQIPKKLADSLSSIFKC